MTDPQIFPEPYRLNTTFGSVHLKSPSNSTFNALLSSDGPDGVTSGGSSSVADINKPQPVERRKSNPFEIIRRGSFSKNFTSMEIPTMKDSHGDVEDGHRLGFSSSHLHPPLPTVIPPSLPPQSEDEIDEEQLDMDVNDILGGVADMEVVENM